MFFGIMFKQNWVLFIEKWTFHIKGNNKLIISTTKKNYY